MLVEQAQSIAGHSHSKPCSPATLSSPKQLAGSSQHSENPGPTSAVTGSSVACGSLSCTHRTQGQLCHAAGAAAWNMGNYICSRLTTPTAFLPHPKSTPSPRGTFLPLEACVGLSRHDSENQLPKGNLQGLPQLPVSSRSAAQLVAS